MIQISTEFQAADISDFYADVGYWVKTAVFETTAGPVTVRQKLRAIYFKESPIHAEVTRMEVAEGPPAMVFELPAGVALIDAQEIVSYFSSTPRPKTPPRLLQKAFDYALKKGADLGLLL